MTKKLSDVKTKFKEDILLLLDEHLKKFGKLEIRYQVMDGYAGYLFEKDRLRISGYANFAGISAESAEYDTYRRTGNFPDFGAEFFKEEILNNITFELICDIAKRLKD